MALSDLEVFLQERARVFDENLDVSSGSPFDTQVVQPLLRRLGTDPFTVDLLLFVQTRLTQDFPELVTKEGDAITDLLIKPATLLWDPILREINRIKNQLSFRDPTTLTLEEAASLGANLFSELNTGTFAKGSARIYFAQPQSISISPANFVTSKSGLHFFPSSTQSIRANEMLLNVEGTLYYFDVNVIAEEAGDEYNISVDELVSIANVASAVRITNLRRFRSGTAAETAVDFVGRSQQELSERSLVTYRGISAKLQKSFPEINRLAVVGFNDPEMQRDVVTGGGLGDLKAFGTGAVAASDGENNLSTRRVDMAADSVNFTSLIGPTGPVSGWSLTLINAFNGVAPAIRDITVSKVISATVLELEDQVVFQNPSLPSFTWMLRKKELTLSGIPGGILFPDSQFGTVGIPSGQIHIGGATDIYVRGPSFDSSSITILNLVDDSPILSGTALNILDEDGNISLTDLTLGTDYQADDSAYTALEDATSRQFVLVILDGAAAGSYRVLSATQTLSSSPELLLDPAPAFIASTDFRWRLLDAIDIDLIEPKQTKVFGTDLRTVQGTDFVDTLSGIDFQSLGVTSKDILRIENGPDAGDYIVSSILGTFYDRVQILGTFKASTSNLSYSIFTPSISSYAANGGTNGITRPFVRVTSIDLLDTSSQPVGSTIPYSKPIDARSSSFANTGHGVKVEVRDATLGLVSQVLTGSPAGANVTGLTLTLAWDGGSTTIGFSGSNPVALTSIVSQINTALGMTAAFVLDETRLGIAPINGYTNLTGGTARTLLFGDTTTRTTYDIRSASISALDDGWRDITPPLDRNDIVQVLDGYQIGAYDSPDYRTGVYDGSVSNSLIASDDVLKTSKSFAPEVNRHIQVGSRSLGTIRFYFLNPTSIEFTDDAYFEVDTDDSGVVRYSTDPVLEYQILPALPSGDLLKDGVSAYPVPTLASASVDFIQKGVQAGDILLVTYKPIRGTVSLTDPVADLALTTLILSIDNGSNKVITFINDSSSIAITAVTRAGVAAQINRLAGKTICSIVDVAGIKYLEFETNVSVVIRKTGTANALLGFSTSSDRNNDSGHKGRYLIQVVTETALVVTPSFADVGSQSRQMFSIVRPGMQRIVSTSMAEQVAAAGLYYFDVEVVSQGTGDLYNIEADKKVTAFGYSSDGYYLTTDDENLSFSPVEQLRMVLSKSILEVGVSDDAANATQLSGQNIKINYEYSSLTGSVNNFILAETERVVNESPLARHLIPYFVRFDLTYIGGSKESEIKPFVEDYINQLSPDDSLESSDLQKVVSNKGATSIDNPIDLIAIVHNTDRSVVVERSKNKLNTGRLAAFIPDVLNITRKIS